jgi:hypothetical protein
MPIIGSCSMLKRAAAPFVAVLRRWLLTMTILVAVPVNHALSAVVDCCAIPVTGGLGWRRISLKRY